MKTLRNIMMALFAIATLGMTVACEKSDGNDDGTGAINSTIIGTWKVRNIVVDSMQMSQDLMPNMNITMNENGSGVVESESDNPEYDGTYNFTWVRNDNTLIITLGRAQLTYTITKLTRTDCVIKGTVVPVLNREGDVRIDMSRLSSIDDDDPEDPNDTIPVTPVDTIDFPAATNWICNYSQANLPVEIEGTTYYVTASLTGTLNFAASTTTGTLRVQGGISGSFPEVGEASLPLGPVNTNITYTFNATTNTGIMIGNIRGEEVSMPFTYDSENNTITIPASVVIPASDITDIPEEYRSYIPQYVTFTQVNK